MKIKARTDGRQEMREELSRIRIEIERVKVAVRSWSWHATPPIEALTTPATGPRLEGAPADYRDASGLASLR